MKDIKFVSLKRITKHAKKMFPCKTCDKLTKSVYRIGYIGSYQMNHITHYQPLSYVNVYLCKKTCAAIHMFKIGLA